ncbi:SubName: Full=Related to GTR1-GTP-binding protein {ECO:0000313/EMBL:CCA73495.1} [Serendipita indica DSM 11827]|nr:SubName: Full=Related to GTR1-GTP-binding protein {ECO:0000313/EMBL:CCA73495.1} [Serendipita indica DSM 11827]
MPHLVKKKNVLPSLTHRLGATIDVEQSHQRFLGSLVLNLWDCGGQSSFLESYLNSQKSTVFAHVGVLIYVFDVDAGAAEWRNDLAYFQQCLRTLFAYSPDAAAFVLVHKMAWSQIVHTLIPNATALKRGLTTLTRACGAVEAVLFEKTTFLLIAHSEGLRSMIDENLLMASSSSSSPVSTEGSSSVVGTSVATDNSSSTLGLNVDGVGGNISTSEKKRLQLLSQLSANRFERISSLLKVFKLSCPNWTNGEKWHGLHIQLPEFAAVIEPLTVNSYVMVLSADERITPEAIRINIRMAKQKFEDLQAGSV